MRFSSKIFLIYFLLVVSAFPKDITFEWDASPDTDVTKYIFYGYKGETRVKTVEIPVVIPAATYTCVVSLEPGEILSANVVAVNAAGLISEPSNTVTLPVAKGDAPDNLKIQSVTK